MNDLFPIGIDEQIAEIERELEMRRTVYPRWIRVGRIDNETANRRIVILEEARQTLIKWKYAYPPGGNVTHSGVHKP